MRWTVVVVLSCVALVACRPSRPAFEYEPPITITHTDAPAAAAAPVTSTTVPARPSSWVRGGTK